MDTAKSSELLKPADWPTPKWYSSNEITKLNSYETQLTFQLRTRYVSLETDFRAVLGNFAKDIEDAVTTERAAELLHHAREHLEQKTKDLLAISSSLDLVERLMVWMYPIHVMKARINTLMVKVESLPERERRFYTGILQNLIKPGNEDYHGQFRSELNFTIGAINENIVDDHVATRLQLNRLAALTRWGLFLLVLFFILSPLATNLAAVKQWPIQDVVSQILADTGWKNLTPIVTSWINAAAMLSLGAVGGFISGLLQAQSSQVTLAEYLENILKLQLRPMVGAIIALILYTLLSWDIFFWC